jgi:antitoxin component of MazEF toxin-antitoxin module
MIEQITLREEGDSIAAILPDAMAERLNLMPGSRAYAIKTKTGILLMTDPQLVRALDVEERVNRRYANALRELGS